ncbi:hypothetical protein BH09BAC1_BH09BAC1_26360 [soil metagenome]
MDIVRIEQIVKLGLGIILGVIVGFIVGMLTNIAAAILVAVITGYIFSMLLYKRREVLSYNPINANGDKTPNPRRP